MNQTRQLETLVTEQMRLKSKAKKVLLRVALNYAKRTTINLLQSTVMWSTVKRGDLFSTEITMQQLSIHHKHT